MRKWLILAALVGLAVFLIAVGSPAQEAKPETRVLIGVDSGSSFGNLYAGTIAAVELPVIRRMELDASDLFSPVEQHYPYGFGWANKVEGGGIVWLNNSLGVNGNVEYSRYRVSISKHAEYALAGVTYRKSVQYMPVRFTFDYIGEFNNGIDATGTESSRLKGGQFTLDMRVKCAGPACYRVAFNFAVGAVKTQGNQACDGSYGGPVTCPRGTASAGAFSGRLSLEIPRRRATEEEAF